MPGFTLIDQPAVIPILLDPNGIGGHARHPIEHQLLSLLQSDSVASGPASGNTGSPALNVPVAAEDLSSGLFNFIVVLFAVGIELYFVNAPAIIPLLTSTDKCGAAFGNASVLQGNLLGLVQCDGIASGSVSGNAGSPALNVPVTADKEISALP